MIKRLFLVFVLLLFPSISFADEYVLVMSKEDNVCQYMLKLYNEDLKKYGEVRYDEHEEFTAIKWEEKRYYTTRHGKKDYSIMDYGSVIISRFDINNDGKEEIIVKEEGSLKGILSENLYYFKGEDSDYFKDEFDIKILYNKAIRKLAFTGGFYDLKELPQFLYLGIGGKEVKGHYLLAGHFYINPFAFKETYYIDMKDNEEIGNFLVILKYTKDNQIKDVCYYLKVSDCKNNNSKRR